MTKVRDLIGDALIEIGVYSPSDTVPAEDFAFGLRTLNRMIKVWNTENLTIYTVNRNVFNLTASQQTYTLGTGGNFNISRPVRVQSASVLINTASTPLELPINIVTDEEWQAVSIKGTTSTFPTKAWITGDLPLNNVWLWPVPTDATVQLVLYCWGQTVDYTDVNVTVIFPNGYEEAIVSTLALMLSSSYGVQPSQTLIQRSMLAKNNLQSLNVEPVFASIDPSLVNNRGRSLAVQTQGLQIDP